MLTLSELLRAVGGEMVLNVPRYRDGGRYITLAVRRGDQYEFTQEGRKLAEKLSEPAVEDVPVRRRRRRALPEE